MIAAHRMAAASGRRLRARRVVGVLASVGLALACSTEKNDGKLHVRSTLPKDYQGPVVLWFVAAEPVEPKGKTGTLKLRLPMSGVLELKETLRWGQFQLHLMKSAQEEIPASQARCPMLRMTMAGEPNRVVVCSLEFLSDRAVRTAVSAATLHYQGVLVTDSAHLETAYNAAWDLVQRKHTWLDSTDRWHELGTIR